MKIGPNPLMALGLIDRLELYHTIFTDPTISSEYKPDGELWKVAYNLVNEVITQGGELQKILLPDAEHAYIAWILSAFVPWVDAPASMKGGKPGPSMAVTAAREGIKSPNKVCEIVNFSVRHFKEIVAIKDAFLKAARLPQQAGTAHNPLGRDTLGMALRKWGVSWKSQLLYAMMVELTQRSSYNSSKLTQLLNHRQVH